MMEWDGHSDDGDDGLPRPDYCSSLHAEHIAKVDEIFGRNDLHTKLHGEPPYYFAIEVDVRKFQCLIGGKWLNDEITKKHPGHCESTWHYVEAYMEPTSKHTLHGLQDSFLRSFPDGLLEPPGALVPLGGFWVQNFCYIFWELSPLLSVLMWRRQSEHPLHHAVFYFVS